MRCMAAFFAMVVLCLGSAHAQQAPQAFVGLRPAAEARPAQRERVRLIQAEPRSLTVHIARVSTEALRSARVGQTIRFQVGPDAVAEARTLRSRTEDRRWIWTGEVLSRSRVRPPGLARIIVSGGDVIGSIEASDGRVYSLRPLGAGEVAIIELNPAAARPDHAEGLPARAPRRAVRSSPEAAAWRAAFYRQLEQREALRRWATVAYEVNLAQNYALMPQFWTLPVVAPEITVLVAYTSASQALHGNVPLMAADAVEQTNNAHFNSKVFARLRLVGTMQVSYQEPPWTALGFVKAHNDLANGLEGLNSVHAQREALDADIVVLIIGTLGPCGYAGPDLAVDAAAAFVVVHYDCATNQYSFAHEIGHLIGAGHDIDNYPALTPYAWGHGYRNCAEFRTIMAYFCDGNTGLPKRVLFWSSPLTTWNGLPMGSAELADNRRVWNERAFDVSLFR
jgi:hypothetical protein